MARRIPYTNFHDLNLDWIIKRIQNVYNDENPPPYPVRTVNGQVGNVHLTGDDIPVSPNDNTEVSTALASKYVKPAGGIPKSDLAAGVQSYLNAIADKLDKPSVAGQAGQVLTSDGNNGQSWQTPVNPASIIDDASEYGVADKTWSAGKLFQMEADIVDIENDISDLTDVVEGIENTFPEYDNLYFESGGIGSSGGTNSLNTRIRTKYDMLTPIYTGDVWYCDSDYLCRIAVYSQPTISSANFIAFVNPYSNGFIEIPANYAGYYAGIVIEKVDHENDDISADVANIQTHIKYLSLGTKFSEYDTYTDWIIENSNTIIPLDGHFLYDDNGIKVLVENGIISINGTLTTTLGGVLRIKLTNGFDYVIKTSDPSGWNSDTLSGFVPGDVYSIHNIIIEGSIPSNTGAIVRDTNGSIVLSRSNPQVTLSVTPSHLTLQVQKNTAINVKFVPVIVHGTLTDPAWIKKINDNVYIPGVSVYEMPDLSQNFIYDNSIDYAIKLPQTYKDRGEKTPMVIICHGLSSTISSSTWGGTSLTNIVNTFASEGLASIDVNQVTTADWCNPALIHRYIKAIADATHKYNVVPMYIYGYSMGSLIALVLAQIYKVKSVVISGLRLDLQARYAQMTASEQAIVDSNLGFANGYDAYECSGWNKTAFELSDGSNLINPNQFPPCLFMWGSSDTLTTTESIARAEAIKRGGTIGYIVEYTGDHAQMCALTAPDTMLDCINWFHDWY